MKDQDSRLIWEQYASTGRVGGGNIPYPDGRGEHDEITTTQRSPNQARVESEKNVALAEDYYLPLIDDFGAAPAEEGYTGLTPEPGTSEASQYINVMVYLTDTLSKQKIEYIRTVINLHDMFPVNNKPEEKDAIDIINALYESEITKDENGKNEVTGAIDLVWPGSEEGLDYLKNVYMEMMINHQNPAAESYTGFTPESGDTESRQFTNILEYIFDDGSMVDPSRPGSKMNLLQAVLDDPDVHQDVAYYLSTEEMSSEKLVGLTDGGSLPF